MKFFLPRHGTIVLVLAALFFVIDAWGHISRAYPTVWWVDIAEHLLFGAWLTLALLYPRLWPYHFAPLAAFSIVMLVGLGWEGFEYLYDILYALPNGADLAQHGPWDTAKDIINNALGAGAALVAYRSFGR